MALLDRLMPRWDVADRHEIVVRAAPDAAYAAVRTVDFAGSPITRLLFALRTFRAPPKGVTLRDAPDGFTILGEEPGREIVLGTVGRFWTLPGGKGSRVRVPRESFRDHVTPGTAKAAMSFWIEPIDGTRSRVITETRVLCADEGARRTFRLYWSVVRFGSALIRKLVLRSIKRTAERGA